MARTKRAGAAVDAVNDVHLVGRVSGPAQHRMMPSGDELVSFRLVVDREQPRQVVPDRRRPTVDVIDVACWTARTRRTALNLQDGDAVKVHGALRRRFWRAGGAAISRYEVESAALSKVRKGALER